MARERIGLLEMEGVVPSGLCFVVDLVKGWTTRAALVGVSVLPALLLLDGPLTEGSGSHLAFGPLLSLGVSKVIRNLRTVMLPDVLKGLLNL